MSMLLLFGAYFIPSLFSLVLWYKIFIIKNKSYLSFQCIKVIIWSLIPIANIFCVSYAIDSCSVNNWNA